jgi:hypothetical protein
MSMADESKKEVTPAIALATLSQEVAQFSNSQLGFHRTASSLSADESKKEVTPAISLATLSQEVAQFSNSQLGFHRQDARTVHFECSMKSKR